MAIKDMGTGIIDELIVSGNTEVHTKGISLATNKVLARGTLIGKSDNDAYGVYDGSNFKTAYGILAEEVANSNGVTIKAMIYVSGHFNANKIIGYDEMAHYDTLREKGIFVEKALAY